ncbi:MAG: phosphatidylglycerol lysyltransferase domain-containing protein [Solirubrobacteraceae bacterium]
MTLTSKRTLRLTPGLAALAAASVGLINVASTLTPNISWRGHLLLGFEPVEAIQIFHAFALPAGTALLLVAPYLSKRRWRAWQAAVTLMIVLGALDLLKGLDFEETAITWATAALLIAGRSGFGVKHDPLTLRTGWWRAPLVGILGVTIAIAAAWASQGRPSWGSVLAETGRVLTWQSATSAPLHPAPWLALSVHFVELVTLIAIAYVVFRPLSGPRALPGPMTRDAAAELVRAHGSDTLSFFKLREDKHYFFSADRAAFVGYRIENGVLLLSGDPVGPAAALPRLLSQLQAFAEVRGLKLGAVGASQRMCPLYEELGLRTLYLGDEAIIELERFSLEGRPIRKVRQSVARLQKAGFTAELREVADLDRAAADEIELVLERGREGTPERGFSMAMDSIGGDYDHDTLVVVARDETNAIKGVLHFVPCYGRSAMSLSFMRRDPETPNGLTEFMVVRAIELLRERQVGEISLNFAAFAKWMHSPERRAERILAKLIALGNRFFQIESLYRFNAKFFPRWEPRYLVYQGALGLPRTSLAAMWAEGQLWKPERRRAAPLGGGRLSAHTR